MANRYWVGGNGTWNTASTANWSLTSGGAAGAAAPTSSDTAIFDANSGTGNYTVSTAATGPTVAGITITDPAGTGNTLTFDTTAAAIALTSSTSVTFTFSSTTGSVVFTGTNAVVLNGGVTISTPLKISFGCPITHSATVANTWTFNNCTVSGNFNRAGATGTLNFGSNFTTSGTIAFTSGVINLSTYTVTGQTVTHNGTLNFGVGSAVNITGTSGTVFNTLGSSAAFSGTTNFNLTGNPPAGTTRTIAMNSLTTASASFKISAGSDTIAISTYVNLVNLDFTGFNGTFDVASPLSNVTGNITLSSTMTMPDATLNCVMTGAGTQVVTTNGVTFGRLFYVQSTGTVQFADAFTSTRGIYHTTGTLDLSNKTVTCLVYSNTGSATRALAFGSIGKMYCTNSVATNIPFAIAVATGFTLTGTSAVYITNNTGVATSASGTPSGTEAQAVSFFVTGGTYALTLSGAIKNLDFTGFGGSLAATTRTIFGNLILSSGMTVTGTSSITTFSGSSGTKTITSNGTSLNCNITFDGAGSTFKFLDAANNSGRPVTLTNGILDLNGQTVSLGSVTTAAGTKNITFNGGYLYLTGATGFSNAVPAGFTTTAGTANGFIYMAYTLGKTFAGGGSSFAATLVQAAAGALTVTGSNTFLGGLTNTTQPAPIAFTSSTTNTFNGDIKLKGTAGKLIVITAVTAGTAATWSHTGSTVSCDYVSIKDNTAAGTVPFYAGAHSTLVSNTTNWSNRPPLSANTEFLTFF